MKLMNKGRWGMERLHGQFGKFFLFFLAVGNDILASDPFTQKLMIIFWFRVNPFLLFLHNFSDTKCILLFTCLFIHSFTFV